MDENRKRFYQIGWEFVSPCKLVSAQKLSVECSEICVSNGNGIRRLYVYGDRFNSERFMNVKDIITTETYVLNSDFIVSMQKCWLVRVVVDASEWRNARKDTKDKLIIERYYVLYEDLDVHFRKEYIGDQKKCGMITNYISEMAYLNGEVLIDIYN